MLLECVAALALWWAAGGWAYRQLEPTTPNRLVQGLFVGCLLIGPFVFGIAIAELHRPAKKEGE